MPRGPGRLKGIYCWFRGEPESGGPFRLAELAKHFLSEHTDADVDTKSCRVEAVHGGDLQFAMNPKDGLLFDFAFAVPGGIGDEDVVVEGRCDCHGVREFAVLLDFE